MCPSEVEMDAKSDTKKESAIPGGGRLLLISNRLPISVSRNENGTYETKMSSGGLVSGLSGLAKSTVFQWYGWPGQVVPEEDRDGLCKTLADQYNAHPVFLGEELADKHYNGFSSTAIHKT